MYYYYWTWKRVRKRYHHCSCSCSGSCSYQIFKVLRLFLSVPIVIKLRVQIGDNILHSHTVADFKVKS